MTTKYRATIKYNTGPDHPDAPGANGLIFEDIYTIDDNYFSGPESVTDYIKQDLLLVAGGGYNWKNLTSYAFNIRRTV